MLSCFEVANYFLTKSDDEEAGELISNLKLQKLAYYAQGFHLAIFGEPLFPERIEAWTHGPVVPDLYHVFKSHGYGRIPPSEEFAISAIPEETRDILDEVFEVFGQYSALKLRAMTHEEPPWRDTPPGEIISNESMREYFGTRLTA